MPAPVPVFRTEPQRDDVLISSAVRGRTWRDLALLQHWIRAHGMVLIPVHSPRMEIDASSTETLRYRVEPSGRAIARVWAITLRSLGQLSASGLVTFPDGATRRAVAGYIEGLAAPPLPALVYVEELSAKSAALQTLALEIAHGDDVDEGIVVESVGCYELPRAVLTAGDATDLGLEIDSYRSGAAILDDGSANSRSVAALAGALAQTELRRSLVQMSFPVVSVALADGAVDVFALEIPVVPRKIRRSDATAPVQCAVYARVTTTDTVATITIAATRTADSAVFTLDGAVDGTALAMLTALPLTLSCEELEADDGDGGDSIQVTLDVTSGTGSVEIEGVYVWEAPSSAV